MFSSSSISVCFKNGLAKQKNVTNIKFAQGGGGNKIVKPCSPPPPGLLIRSRASLLLRRTKRLLRCSAQSTTSRNRHRASCERLFAWTRRVSLQHARTCSPNTGRASDLALDEHGFLLVLLLSLACSCFRLLSFSNHLCLCWSLSSAVVCN